MHNLEAKFRLDDLARARERATAIGYVHRAELVQRDTFFRVAEGKLKLREEGDTAALIYYNRQERQSLQLSNYEIVPLGDGPRTRRVLAEALGILAEVRKHRTLLTRANVRLHLDKVAGLGLFGEIEAVIGEGENPETCRGAIDLLLTTLQIAPSDLIDVSYFELLLRRCVDC